MIEQWYYLLALVVSICGLIYLDFRYKLAFWQNTRKTVAVIAVAMTMFIAWDLLGILTGIFFKGDSQYMLPFVLAPEFPVEELFFLFLLNYVTLLMYIGASRWQRTS